MVDNFYLNLLDWSSKGVVAIGLGSAVHVWNSETGSVSEVVSGDSDVTSVAWADNGTHLAVGFEDQADCVQLWAVEPCRKRHMLATGGGSSDKSIKVWNAQEGSLLSSTFTGSQAPDRRTVATAAADETLRVLILPPSPPLLTPPILPHLPSRPLSPHFPRPPPSSAPSPPPHPHPSAFPVLSSSSPSPRVRAAFERWSDAATWEGGDIPGQGALEGANVTIPCGKAVLLDTSPVLLTLLNIQGVLMFEDTASLPLLLLNASFILLQGRLAIGAQQQHFSQRAVLTLTPNPSARAPLLVADPLPADAANPRNLGHKALAVLGGRLDLHGMPGGPSTRSWCQLTKTAPAGATSLLVGADVSAWPVGGLIAVSSTDYSTDQAEDVTITAVTTFPNGTSLLTLSRALTYSHFGDPLGVPDGFGGYINERAEVALLSRTVTITSIPESSPYDREGGHVSVYFTQRAQAVEGVEFSGLGQEGLEGRFPLHYMFHENQGQTAVTPPLPARPSHSFFPQTSSSLPSHLPTHRSLVPTHGSSSRCLVLTAASGMTVESNVAYDTRGHCFMLSRQQPPPPPPPCTPPPCTPSISPAPPIPTPAALPGADSSERHGSREQPGKDTSGKRDSSNPSLHHPYLTPFNHPPPPLIRASSVPSPPTPSAGRDVSGMRDTSNPACISSFNHPQPCFIHNPFLISPTPSAGRDVSGMRDTSNPDPSLASPPTHTPLNSTILTHPSSTPHTSRQGCVGHAGHEQPRSLPCITPHSHTTQLNHPHPSFIYPPHQPAGMCRACGTRATPPQTSHGFLVPPRPNPATFLLANPDNDFINNTAAGSLAAGVWYYLRWGVSGLAGTIPGYYNLLPFFTPWGAFSGCTFHSNGLWGLQAYPMGAYPRLGAFRNFSQQNPYSVQWLKPIQRVLFSRLTFYKHQGSATLMDTFDAFTMQDSVFADNQWSLYLAETQHAIVDGCRFVGLSNNYGTPQGCTNAQPWDCAPITGCKLPLKSDQQTGRQAAPLSLPFRLLFLPLLLPASCSCYNHPSSTPPPPPPPSSPTTRPPHSPRLPLTSDQLGRSTGGNRYPSPFDVSSFHFSVPLAPDITTPPPPPSSPTTRPPHSPRLPLTSDQLGRSTGGNRYPFPLFGIVYDQRNFTELGDTAALIANTTFFNYDATCRPAAGFALGLSPTYKDYWNAGQAVKVGVLRGVIRHVGASALSPSCGAFPRAATSSPTESTTTVSCQPSIPPHLPSLLTPSPSLSPLPPLPSPLPLSQGGPTVATGSVSPFLMMRDLDGSLTSTAPGSVKEGGFAIANGGSTVATGSVSPFLMMRDLDGSLTGTAPGSVKEGGFAIANVSYLLPPAKVKGAPVCAAMKAWNGYACPKACYRSVAISYFEPGFSPINDSPDARKRGSFSYLEIVRVEDKASFALDGNLNVRYMNVHDTTLRYFYPNLLAGMTYEITIRSPNGSTWVPSYISAAFQDGGSCAQGLTLRVLPLGHGGTGVARQLLVGKESSSVGALPIPGNPIPGNRALYSFACASVAPVPALNLAMGGNFSDIAYLIPIGDTAAASSCTSTFMSTQQRSILFAGSDWLFDDSGLDYFPPYSGARTFFSPTPLLTPPTTGPKKVPSVPRSIDPPGTWRRGKGPLGWYANWDNPAIATVLAPVSPSRVVYYFRTNFTITNTKCYTSLRIDLLISDGAVVYINGVEAFRTNLPDGALTNTSL
ncbi:unnamed protein product, partial [Closterium sp. Naga37s-1]